eukprot:CAMPEP_0194353772 /NCGR_PEP_ID=MMETSP0174-20130528/2019_1 /TAXON_ID=216777 /ORGANISM="Proboscia alata, Strain PI-D3" /LENGTH=244 /DNA_ID=CAMNT_0039122447 /DNA_START=353 /DNA_END=1087 /DNA_ORIENTATION=+
MSCPVTKIQSDGNLVVYNPNTKRSIWRMRAMDNTATSTITVQDDGILQMTQTDVLVWSLEAPSTGEVESTSDVEEDLLPSFEDVTVPCGFLGTSWDTVPVVKKEAAINLGYSQCSWENPPFQNLDYVEYYPWWNITDEEKEDAQVLGCDEQSWNKMITHYYSYYWQDFVADGIEHCIEKLGYNQVSWDEGVNPPESETQYFDELSADGKDGAECLGYSQSTWDTSWEIDCYVLKYGTVPPVPIM